MKKTKIIVITIIAIIICYLLYISIEVIRFNNYLGAKPLITIGEINVNIEAGSNIQKEKISSIGYTTEYEYLVERKEDSDNQTLKLISGQLRLFDKFILSVWIE